jgi:nicotinate-nucleotide adenylyltransferase
VPGALLDLSALEARLPGITSRVTFVDGPLIDISATALRDTIRAGHSIRYQVPEPVAAYIDTHRLYR